MRESKRAGRWWWGLGLGTTVLAALLVGGIGWTWIEGWSTSDRTSEPATLRWEEVIESVRQQQGTRSETLLREWLEHHPEDGSAQLMLAHILASSDRADEARALLIQVAPNDPNWPGASTLLGELALGAFDAQGAERAFRAVADRDPKAQEPRGRLIYLFSLQQRPAEVREMLWQLYQASGDPGVLIDLVIEATRPEIDVRGIPPEVERFLQRAPDDPFLNRAQGLSLLWRGQADAALPHLEAAAAALVDDPLGRFALAECLTQLGRPVEVPEVLGPIPDPPADAARWWTFRGQLEEAADQRVEAIARFRRAIELNPESAEAQHRLAQALAAAGEESAAEHARLGNELRERWADLRRTFSAVRGTRFGNDPGEFMRLGDHCRSVNLLAEARAWYEHALTVAPWFDPARDALADLDDRAEPFPVALSRPRRLDNEQMGNFTTEHTENTEQKVSTTVAPRFEDITASSGIEYQYDYGPREDIFLADTIGGGVGLIDFDGDGWLDIYFVNGCQLPYDRDNPPRPNKLYRNRGDGTFEDVTEAAGVAGLGYGMGCAVGDFDNDGFDDLFVTGLDRTILYRNRGDGTFEDVTEAAGVFSDRWTTAAGFADLDGDGNLDLFVVAYVEDDSADPLRCFDPTGRRIHCALYQYNAQQDHLFRNNGDGTFTDVSAEAGINAPDGRGLGLAIADLDGDGRLDLFVANDLAPDFFYRNLGDLRFEEIGVASGLAFNGSGHATASMGVVADDLDGDGRIDLLHTNFLNEANTLHQNIGGGYFIDATFAAGLGAPSLATTGFGVAALDVNNDGWLDLFIANGHVDDQPEFNAPMAQRPQLFLGQEGGRFALADPSAFPYLGRRVVGRGLAAGDLDNDGRVDLVVVHRDAPAVILRNSTEGGHWFGLRLIGTDSGRTPVGARVRVEAGGRRQVRWQSSGTSYLSANDPRLWFGLGEAETIDRLEVQWPSGRTQVWSDLPGNHIFDLREGADPHPAEG